MALGREEGFRKGSIAALGARSTEIRMLVAGLVGSVFWGASLLTSCVPVAAQEAPATETVAAEADASEAVASLSRAELPREGDGSSVLTVPSFGRYGIWVESDTGVALQWVDKMAGPGGWSGRAGESDGRHDVFLDRGELLIRSRGPKAAEPVDGAEPAALPVDGRSARLRVERFRPRSDENVFLPPQRTLADELADFEEASWWLKIKERERVVLEAAGRHLGDLRLWRDGTWLEAAEPGHQIIEPKVGRPLHLYRLSTVLEPGLYRLTAYGGPSADWTEDDGSRPLYIRSGIPTAPEAARRRLSVSPFGFDRFLVPGSASYFRLELGADGPAGEQTSLRVQDWREDQPFAESGNYQEITKENRRLSVEISLNVREQETRLVTVKGQAGEPFVLQHFRADESRKLPFGGLYFVGTVHPGPPGDNLDATALLTRNENRSTEYEKAVESQALTLKNGVVIRRRFNLHQKGSLFLRVGDAGSYKFALTGDGTADLLLEPWFPPSQIPKDYRRPEPRSSGGEWQLDPGFYRATLIPRRPGIMSLLIHGPNGDSVSLPMDQQPLRRSAVRFSEVSLRADDHYVLHLNRIPGARAGAIVRPLPLDLEQALPLVADDSQPVELAFKATRAGKLMAEAENGERLEVSVDDGPWSDEVSVDVGRYRARVRPSADQALPLAYSLALVPDAWSEPPPPVPAELLALPEFPSLEPGESRRFELARDQRQTFQLEVEKAALYRLESTGLLDTEGVLRTRARPVLQTRSEGGDGRNFAVQMYLRPGTYQAEVKARRGEGRAGLRLFSSPVRDGGRLHSDVSARGWLRAGEALEYSFQIPAEGRYRIRTQGLGRSFPIRLEDAEGWPLIPPGRAGDLTLELRPGTYRWVVLPQEVDARQWTLLEPLGQAEAAEGPGPHELPLERWLEHLWLEPSDGPRGDRWRFQWPADGEARIQLSEGMEADLLRDGSPVVFLPRNKGFEGPLVKGAYELQVRSARIDNRVAYRLRVEPVPLMVGTSRVVEVPSELDVAVGEAGLVELSSLGRIDVRARLFALQGDGRGELLAEADDRPGDWNFRLSRRLAEGSYRLVLDALSESGRVEVSMARPQEMREPEWSLPLGQTVDRSLAGKERQGATPGTGSGAFRLPLNLPSEADTLLIHARSADHLRVTLEKVTLMPATTGPGATAPVTEERGADQGTEVFLVVPLQSKDPGLDGPDLGADGPWSLRVESLDQSGNRIELHAVALIADRITEAEAAAGAKWRSVDGMPGGTGVLAVDLERPGCFRLASGTAVGPRLGHALARTDALVSTVGSSLWLSGAVGRRAGLQRHVLSPGDPSVRLWLPGGSTGACDLKSAESSAWVIAEGLAGPVALGADAGDFSAQDSDGRQSLAVTDSGAVYLRSGDGRAGDVDLRLVTGDEIVPALMTGGGHELSLEPSSGIELELPEGRKLLQLTLSQGLAAALDGGKVLWARSQNRQITLSTDSSSILIQDLSGEGGAAAVAGLPSSMGSVLEWGRPWERPMERAGSVVLTVPAMDQPLDFEVLGAEDVVWHGADGVVAHGTSLRLGPSPGGYLTLKHGVGWLAARLIQVHEGVASEARADARKDLGFDLDAEPAQRITPPARVELVEGSRWLIETTEPVVLHLQSPGPVAAWVDTGASQAQSGVFPQGMGIHLPAEPGVTELLLRGLGGQDPSGFLDVRTSPVVDIGEGLGPEVLLRPGETRFYRFVVAESATVGFGARAESGEVEGWLMDRDGAVLGRGAVQMAALEAGEYFFALSLGADELPVRVRPAVVGLQGPGNGPPPEVIEDYLKLRASESEARP